MFLMRNKEISFQYALLSGALTEDPDDITQMCLSTSFVDLLCFFLSCVCYVFVRICLYVPWGHLLGKN